MDRKVVVIDTNILLHYKLPNEIDWCTKLQCKEAEIIITRKVMSELNAHKDRHASKWESKRASVVIKHIHNTLINGALLGPKVILTLQSFNPSINFSAYQLHTDAPDDWVLASAVQLHQERNDADVVVLTNDMGQANAAKSLGLQGIWWSDNEYRLPDEPDPDQKRIKQLEDENKKLKDRVPVLDLNFPGQIRKMELSRLRNPQEYVDAELARARSVHQPLDVPDQLPNQEVENKSRRVITKNELFEHLKRMNKVVDGISLGARYDYNSLLKKYLEELEAHLNAVAFYESQVVELQIVVENNGTCPAEDTDISIEFPDGISVMDEDDLPKRTERPEPPERPVCGKEYEPAPLRSDHTGFANWAGLIPHGSHPISNVRGPVVDASGRQVKFNIGKIKQKTQVRLAPLFVVFDSASGAKSFSFKYRILSEKVPDEVTGNLSIVLQWAYYREPSIEKL